MTITTQDIQTVPYVDWQELSQEEQEQFDWLETDDRMNARFVRYRGNAYCVSDMMPCGKGEEWDFYEPCSAFSRVVFSFDPEDEDQLIVALQLS